MERLTGSRGDITGRPHFELRGALRARGAPYDDASRWLVDEVRLCDQVARC